MRTVPAGQTRLSAQLLQSSVPREGEQGQWPWNQLNIIFCLPPKYTLLLEFACEHMCMNVYGFNVNMSSAYKVPCLHKSLFRRMVFCFDPLNFIQCDNATMGPYAECEYVWVLMSVRDPEEWRRALILLLNKEGL